MAETATRTEEKAPAAQAATRVEPEVLKGITHAAPKMEGLLYSDRQLTSEDPEKVVGLSNNPPIK